MGDPAIALTRLVAFADSGGEGFTVIQIVLQGFVGNFVYGLILPRSQFGKTLFLIKI